MHNKFKINQIVIVNGIGKENGTIYKNRIAKVICRDPFYFDYNIKFDDGTEDWLDGECLKNWKEKFKNENNIHKNSWI